MANINLKDLFGDSDDDSSDDETPVSAAALVAASSASLGLGESDSDDDEDDEDEDLKRVVAQQKKRKKLRKVGDGPTRKKKKSKAAPRASGAGDGFIDSDDDNAELLAEYRAQRVYDSDDDPDPGLDDEEEGGKPEVEEDELAAAMARVSRKGRRKGDKMSVEDREKEARKFLIMMGDAGREDEENRRSGKLSFKKVKMLKSVEAMVLRQKMQYPLLEHDLLGAMGDWLRPIGGVLPSLEVRSKIIELAAMLPVERDHLKKSGFGKVVNYLLHNKKETPENKKRLRKLLQDWSRSIFDKTANFRRLEAMQMDEAVRGNVDRREQRSRGAAVPKAGRAGLDALKRGEKKAVDPNQPKYRAVIPQPLVFDYLHRPAEKVSPAQAVRSARGKGKGDEEGYQAKLAKRMERLRKPVHKNKRAVAISIEGRGT